MGSKETDASQALRRSLAAENSASAEPPTAEAPPAGADSAHTLHACTVFAVALLYPSAFRIIKAWGMTEGHLSLGDIACIVSADAAVACVSAGVTLALIGLVHLFGRGRLLLGTATTSSLFVLLMLTALEHQAWARSASLLDWSIFWYTILHFQELRGVIGSETTVGGVLLLVSAGVLAFLPVALDYLLPRYFGLRVDLSPRYSATVLSAALPFAWAATSEPVEPDLFPLTQSASMGLIAGAFGAASESARDPSKYKPPDAERATQRIAKKLEDAKVAFDPTQGKHKNVLVVVLESTRFDATSAYVPRLETTPRLAELATNGVMVDRAFVDMPHTSKALISVLCGYAPRFTVEVTETEPGGIPSPCLAHILGKLGYSTAFFQAATGTYENRHKFGLNAGYENILTRESYSEVGFEQVNYLAVEDKVIVKPFLSWVQAHSDKPFFATILTCITHHNYGLPSNFSIEQYPQRPAQMGGRLPRPFSDYNRYLNTVRYSDELLGQVLDGLEAQGKLDDTLIVVVGDHGQAFYEHGQKAHNTVIWEEGLRVPLVLYNKELFPEPKVVGGVRRQVDIAPTVLTQLGVSFGPSLFDGRDLLSAPPHERAISSCWYDDRCMAETSGMTRFIDHFDHQPMEAYDLEADPFERRNLLQLGTDEEKNAWQERALAARDRMRAEREANSRRYQSEDQAPFVLTQEPRPMYAVHARLEDAVELIGFDTQSLKVRPDGFWDAVVYFKCLRPSEFGWQIFGVLETLDGRSQQVDHHPANNRLYLHECEAGTIVADHIRVWIPGDYPPGELRYYWGSVQLQELGHVRQTNRRLGRRAVKSLQRGVLVQDKSVLLTKLEVEPHYRPALQELLAKSVLKQAPPITKSLDVHFEDGVTLLEAKVEPSTARRLASVTVTTVWKVESQLRGPWQLLAHLDSFRPGFWLREAHSPVDGIHPVARWEPGTYVIDKHAMPVPEHMPVGEAKVWVGIRTSRTRMEIDSPGKAQIEDRRVLAGTVNVTR